MLCDTSTFKSALQQLVFGRDSLFYIQELYIYIQRKVTDKQKHRHFSSKQIVIPMVKTLAFLVMKMLKC